MAGARENMHLQSETSEFMDQPSVQHERVVTIPPAPNDSSIASASAAAVGFQTLNSPLVVSREGVPTAMSASAANTQGQSRAPRQQRSRWNNPCSWLTFDFFSASIQTILLVVFLPVFRDEPAHVTLQSWVIGTGAGCLIKIAYKRFREQSNRLPQALSVSVGSEVGESQSGWLRRFGIQILKWLWRSLDVFCELWFGVGTGIVYTRWTTGQAPHLSWLSTLFLVIACARFLLPLILAVFIVMLWCVIRVLLRAWPRGAKVNAISAPPTYTFHARETNQASSKEDGVRVSIGGDERVGARAAEGVQCCVCFNPYEDGVEVKELPCMHHFHVKCIDRWLKISDSCLICTSEV